MNNEQSSYKKLFVWQKANRLALEIYRSTKSFPKDEVYGLSSQIRRAALSVPTNLVEGFARQSRKELKRFAMIALGSLAETEYLLEFSYQLNYLNEDEFGFLQKIRQEVGKLLWGFYKSL